MSDYPVISGYEWCIRCPCGETLAADGMSRTDSNGEWIKDRRMDEIPQTDGDTIQCENCDRTWRLAFFEND